MIDETDSTQDGSVTLSYDQLENVSNHFSRIDAGVTALYLAIERVEQVLMHVSQKMHGKERYYQSHVQILQYLTETIRNDMEEADEIINGKYSLRAARALRRTDGKAG